MTPSETDRLNQQRDVIFYWRQGCMFCWMLRRQLDRSGVTLDERNIWQDPDAAAAVRAATGGYETVPTVVVHGRALVNPSLKSVLAELGRNGSIQAPTRLRDRLRQLLHRRR